MDFFQERNGTLYAEDVACTDIAEQFGTPTYVYSAQTIRRHVRVLKEGLSSIDHRICYAVKACGNLAILDLLAQEGIDFDAVSVGELARCLKIGVKSEQLIMSGVGKRDDEIAAALHNDVLYISAESQEEVEAIARVAHNLSLQARVSIRVNPDVDAKTHPYIATGLKKNKFGVPIEAALSIYEAFQNHPSIAFVGVTCHIGSQITTLEPFKDAARRMRTLAEKLIASGIPLRFVGLGGGLGVPYMGESPPSPKIYGEALAEILGSLNLTLVVEPGRVIVGNGGILLSRLVRLKAGQERQFAVLDAGMNDLMRPALYDAAHQAVAVTPRQGSTKLVDVVGPVCETGDTFAKDVSLPPLQEGDLLALRTAGAYGFVMTSTYNGRPRPAEVMVDHDEVRCIRERESLSDLWRGEKRWNGDSFDTSLPAGLSDFDFS